MTVCRLFKMAGIASLLLGVAACDNHGPKLAAPLGDKATLEKLAEGYRAVEERQPLQGSLLGLAPEKRKKFIEMVFAEGGYSYSATLHSLAENKLNVVDQNIKDMAELLLIPHRATTTAIEDIYSAQELKDVRIIESKMK